MSVLSYVNSDSGKELKNLIVGSSLLAPAFAVVPFFLMPVVLGLAFALMGAIVFPIALAGLALGYYLPKEKGCNKTKHAKIGYISGFVAGLFIVFFLLFLPANPAPEQLLALGPRFAGALAGLALPLVASKITIGVSEQSPGSQPVTRHVRSKIKLDSKMYLIVVLAYMACIGLTIFISIALSAFQPGTAIEQARPDIEVLAPESVVMHRGETKVIPIELRIASKEQADVRIWVFSTDSYSSAELEMMSSSGDLDKQFQDMRQKGFADGFNGSLDIDRIGMPANPNGDIITETVNLTLTDS
jgi:hypothetical protein